MAKNWFGKKSKGKHAAEASGAPAPEGVPAGQPGATAPEEAGPAVGAAAEPSADEAATPAADATEGSPSASGSDAAAQPAESGAPATVAEAPDAAQTAPAPAAKGPSLPPQPKAVVPEAPKQAAHGKHSAMPAPAPGAAAEAAAAHPGRLKKALLVAGGVVLGLVLIAYLVGVFLFSGRFYPNTTAADFDISLETPEAVQQQLTDALRGYAFEVKGYGFDMLLTSDDIAMDLDAAAIAQGMRANMNPWLWPAQVWGSHDETQALAATCATDEIISLVTPQVEQLNEGSTLPTDATIAFDEQKGSFVIVPETYGTALDPQSISEQIALGVMTFRPVVELDESSLVQPKVFRDDPRLPVACESANTLVTADVDVLMDGQVAATVDPKLVASWVVLDADLVPSLDDAALTAWVDDLVSRNSTLGSERTYTRADGKVITVSGGSYGWLFDGEALAEQLRSAVKQGTKGTIEVPVQQAAARVVTDGNPDWPTRYVDVDLSEQYARFYGADGSIIWETAIVSGKPGGWETPSGVWVINSKASPSKLIGERDPKTGKPEYETTVQYWMPFIGNSIGFHDATWQSSFGGSRWRTGAGSHGCLNISYSAAEALWGLIGVGDVVVVHY